MEQDKIYDEARKLLKDMQDVPMSRFTLREALFLSRHCLRDAGDEPNIVGSFSQEDLVELLEIALAVNGRGGPTAIH